MLLLKRRVGESIVIGGSIRVSVVEVRGGSVRVAIDAPADMPVYRAELVEKLGEENSRALRAQVRSSKRPSDMAITFPEGLPGLGDNKAFVIFDLDDDHRALVAREDPTVSLLLVDPQRVDPDYPVDRAMARYPYSEEELAIAVVVTRPIDGSMPMVNLAAPIVMGVESRKAVQVLLDDERLPMRAPLYRTEAEARAT
ncbi:MAG TPA: carbon storage regulator [Polyangiales bacterium]